MAKASSRPGTAVRDRQLQGSPIWTGERRTSERAAASRDAEIADRRHGPRYFGGPALHPAASKRVNATRQSRGAEALASAMAPCLTMTMLD